MPRLRDDDIQVALEHDVAGTVFAVGDPQLSGWWIDDAAGVRLPRPRGNDSGHRSTIAG
ncbi:hypothetical protein [Nocardia sp. CNY236]|uniref:hypothetical protein n=1 Tax=Nocardia sp. CNY236 TaxID=1169152 RepID=UPI00041960ED|nr:hypothetical protein [Nocardia sp. CNY236]